jgi:hypothetical protein
VICPQEYVLRYLGKAETATPDEVDLIALLQPQAERLVKEEVGSCVEYGTFTDFLPRRGRFHDADDDFVEYDRVGSYAVPYYAGGDQPLQLKYTPVRKVLSVYETWTPGGALAAQPFAPLLAANYYLDCEEDGLSFSGLLVKPYSSWPRVGRSVRVTYEAGWTPAELDSAQSGRVMEFQLAVMMTVAKVFRTSLASQDQQFGFGGVGPISMESLGGMSFSYDAGGARILTGQITTLSPEVKAMLAPHRNYGRWMPD